MDCDAPIEPDQVARSELISSGGGVGLSAGRENDCLEVCKANTSWDGEGLAIPRLRLVGRRRSRRSQMLLGQRMEGRPKGSSIGKPVDWIVNPVNGTFRDRDAPA